MISAAAVAILLERQYDFGQEVKAVRYELDNLKPSATLVVDVDKFIDADFSGNPNPQLHSVRVDFPGLRYDVPNLRVVYEGSTGPVVCATVTEWPGRFNRRYIRVESTGRCKVFGERVTESRFEGLPTYYYDVKFEAL